MTKKETEAYYEAMGFLPQVAFIDSLSNIDEIEKTINETMEYNENETIYLEVFHMNENINSYSIAKVTGDNYSLWENHNLKLQGLPIKEIIRFIHTNLPYNEKLPYDLYVAEWLSTKTLKIRSFSDPKKEIIINKNNPDDDIDEPILGRYMLPDGTVEYHCITDADVSLLENACEQIHDKNIRLFTKTALLLRQSYIKRKNIYMHTLYADKVFSIMTSTGYSHIKFKDNEIDMMRSAVILSDILKYGWDDIPTDTNSAIINHPTITADVIRSIRGILDPNEVNFIANCIEAHSTENDLNGYKPQCVPDTEYKHVVQLSHIIADYIEKIKNTTT